jgi:DNA-binding MarR family transcriptional regulator
MQFEQAYALNTAIRVVAMLHRSLTGALLAEIGLHPGQDVLLLDLATRGPLSHGQLATAAGCEPPTITNSVRKLEAAGLVERRRSPDDARVTFVALTSEGRALVPALRVRARRIAELTAAQIGDVTSLMKTLTELGVSLGAAHDKLGAANHGNR